MGGRWWSAGCVGGWRLCGGKTAQLSESLRVALAAIVGCGGCLKVKSGASGGPLQRGGGPRVGLVGGGP